MTQLTAPGTVPLNDASWRMSWLIARALDAQQGAQLLAQGQALQKAAMVSREQVSKEAQRLGALVQQLQTRTLHAPWSGSQASRLVGTLLQAGSDGAFRDYLGAEQAVMAIELLLIDTGQAVKLRPQLDELFRLVKDDENFRSSEFTTALRSLQGQVR